jgi:hypothetical protein
MQAAADNNKQWGKKARLEFAQQGKCMPIAASVASARYGGGWEVGSGSGGGSGSGSLPTCTARLVAGDTAAGEPTAPVVASQVGVDVGRAYAEAGVFAAGVEDVADDDEVVADDDEVVVDGAYGEAGAVDDGVGVGADEIGQDGSDDDRDVIDLTDM